MSLKIVFSLMAIMLLIISCTVENDMLSPNVTDVDGNVYNTVVFENDATWMASNLNVKRFKNGDSIFHARTKEEWISANLNEKPAWCYYDGDSANSTHYGRLYNWYAVNDPRGLAPEGWSVASNADWTEIEKFLNAKITPLISSQDSWYNYINQEDTTFSIKPGGDRGANGVYSNKGRDGYYWTDSELNEQNARCRCYGLDCGGGAFNQTKSLGMSVRCIKNNE